MRFMMLMIPSVYQGAQVKNAGADFAPSAADVEQMMKFNEALARAGVLLSLDGFHSPATAARVSFSGSEATVTDGPFADSKETLGGYWMINVKSREEAVEWARRVPAQQGDVIEVRQVFEMEEFPADVQKAAENPIVQEQVKKHQRA